MPKDFCPPTALNDLYERPPVVEVGPYPEDQRISREMVWYAFVRIGPKRYAADLDLTLPELFELFSSRSVKRLIELLLTSMSRRLS